MSAIAARVLIGLGQIAKKNDESTLKGILRVLLGVIVVVVVVLAAIIEILTSPVDLPDEMGRFKEQYGHLLVSKGGSGGGVGLVVSDGDMQAYIASIADPRRRAIIETGASLVGKVPYFWGGKSTAGWNEAWNTPKLVTAAGSSSSGTYRPYGLDCSGYVDWVYRTAGVGDMLSPSPHGGIRGPWRVSYAITDSELQPGDLVIRYDPATTTAVNHIGIYYGRDKDGKKLFLHASSLGGGVVLDSYSGFKFWRRVPILDT